MISVIHQLHPDTRLFVVVIVYRNLKKKMNNKKCTFESYKHELSPLAAYASYKIFHRPS